MYGEELQVGYPTSSALSTATGEFLDLLPANTGWVSENVARALKGMWNAGSVVALADGTYYHPLLSRESAQKQGRPCWSDLVRELSTKIGQSGVLLLTDDYKKRIWPMARVTVVGAHTELCVYAESILGNVAVAWPRLHATLDQVEAIARECQAALGKAWIMTTRRALRESFFEHSLIKALGALRVRELEVLVAPLRDTNEFRIALIIFQ